MPGAHQKTRLPGFFSGSFFSFEIRYLKMHIILHVLSYLALLLISSYLGRQDVRGRRQRESTLRCRERLGSPSSRTGRTVVARWMRLLRPPANRKRFWSTRARLMQVRVHQQQIPGLGRQCGPRGRWLPGRELLHCFISMERATHHFPPSGGGMLRREERPRAEKALRLLTGREGGGEAQKEAEKPIRLYGCFTGAWLLLYYNWL